MTTEEVIKIVEERLAETKDEQVRLEAALMALTGRRKPGRPRLTVAA